MENYSLAELEAAIPEVPGLLRGMQKLAERLPDSDFGLVISTPDGVFRRYPLFSREWAKLACAEVRNLPDAVREKVAETLLSRAVSLLDEDDKHLLEQAGKKETSESSEKRGDVLYQDGRFDLETNKVPEAEKAVATVDFEEVVDDTGNKASVKLSTLQDAKALNAFLEKNAHKLSDRDLREGALGIKKVYEFHGYDLEDPRLRDRPTALVEKYASSIERLGARDEILQDRLQRLEKRSLRVKTSAAILKGKEAYELLCTGSIEAEDLAAKLTALDKALGVSTTLPPYATLFTANARENDLMKRILGEDDPDRKRYRFKGLTVFAQDIKDLKYRPLKPLEPYLGKDILEDFRKDPLAAFEKLDEIQQGFILEWAWRWANEGPRLHGRD